MSRMFRLATLFNGDLSIWDVSTVIDMDAMFRNATSFNGNLCPWVQKLMDTTLVADMFSGSACLDTNTPNLMSTPPGPFCHPCMLCESRHHPTVVSVLLLLTPFPCPGHC